MKGDDIMKQKLFVVFICLISLVILGGCGLEQCNTPEEVLTKLYSGKLKSADEVRKITYLVEDVDKDKDKVPIIIFGGDEMYHALGFKDRANFENETIQRILNIDHSENLKIEKVNLSQRSDYYKVNGTIHYKDGSTEILNNKLVPVVSNPDGKNGKTKHLVNINPLFEQIDFCSYAFGIDGNKKFGIRLHSYYHGNSICFVAVIENFTDDHYILADWPKGANIIWGDKSEMLQMPVTINSKSNPIGQNSYNGSKYHATFVSLFNLGKIVTLDEARELLKKNNSLTINYIIRGENGLPSMRYQKQPLVIDDIAPFSK